MTREGCADIRPEGRRSGHAQPVRVPAGRGAGTDCCLGMPGEEEERAFLAAREELASALRKDSGQAFSVEQLWPLLVTSLPPSARYQQLDAARLVRCNAHGEVRPGTAGAGDRESEPELAAHSSLLYDCSQPQTYLSTLSTALNILEKYGRNLLSPQRPRYWRGVKFNNPVFRSTVDAVQVKPLESLIGEGNLAWVRGVGG